MYKNLEQSLLLRKISETIEKSQNFLKGGNRKVNNQAWVG